MVSQDMWDWYSTASARQILVTEVEAGSPAEGVLQVGDVILGIDKDRFASDPRVVLAGAIDEAERVKNGGELRLLVWRPNLPDEQGSKERSRGAEQTLTLSLKVMGDYSETAPFACAKSDAIRQQTIAATMRENIKGKIGLPILALLASGDEKAMEKAQSAIKNMWGGRPVDTKDENIEKQSAWIYSYRSIILGEYYLLTKDESVLPVIRSINEVLAKGQSNTGDWGHKVAGYAFNGNRLHGRLSGYASLNHPSMTCYYALLIGERCGVQSPNISRAIQKSTENFSYYIDKGAIGYGYHSPRDLLYANNGMSGMAALVFVLQGNRKGARFFSELSGASAHKIEIGHTGPFFNLFWTALGAHLSGPELASAYLKRWRWLQTLCRKWDGGFVYQKPGGGRVTYRRLSAHAAHLLYLSLPQRKLLMTGREGYLPSQLDREEARAIASCAHIDMQGLTVEALLLRLGHALPPVRIAAAEELAKREDVDVAALIQLLRGHYHQKVGACYALRLMEEKAATAVEPLMHLVRDKQEDTWVRQGASRALLKIGKPARRHIPELVSMLLDRPLTDQRREFERVLGLTVFFLSKEGGAEVLDDGLRYKVANQLMNHPHAWARHYGVALVEDVPLKDFHYVAESIIRVIKNDHVQATFYTSDGPRARGLAILERLNIKEGLELCVKTIEPNLWGQKYRWPSRFQILEKYGAHAKPYLPEIREQLGDKGKDIIGKIEASDELRKLISLEEAMRFGSKS